MKLKPIKLSQKGQGKKIKIKRIKTKKDNIIFDKLGLNDEIKNKSNFYKKTKKKN
jgi:hypothetical protein